MGSLQFLLNDATKLLDKLKPIYNDPQADRTTENRPPSTNNSPLVISWATLWRGRSGRWAATARLSRTSRWKPRRLPRVVLLAAAGEGSSVTRESHRRWVLLVSCPRRRRPIREGAAVAAVAAAVGEEVSRDRGQLGKYVGEYVYYCYYFIHLLILLHDRFLR